MDISPIHKETGAFWDEIADTYSVHGVPGEADSIECLRSGGSYLYEHEKEMLGDISPWCKRAIHLQCSGGNDALSLLRQGAAEVVGVDISERLIAVARRKTEALGAPATWYCSDILQTPHALDGTADLVYTGKGALCWMMDIEAWAEVVARLLLPGGRLFIYEAHPLDWAWETQETEYVLDRGGDAYFSDQLREGLFSRNTVSVPRSHQWTLGQIVNSVIGVGLSIERFEEYPEPFWDQFPNMPPETLHRLPHTFSLLACKASLANRTL